MTDPATDPVAAPRDDRVEPAPVAGEREQLLAFLEYHRDTFDRKVAGLTQDQLRSRSVEPSSLSLLGLARHLAEVERSWFRRGVAGQADALPLTWDEDNPDGDFDDVEGADVAADLAWLAAEQEFSRQVVATRSLDDVHDERRGPRTLRWVVVHVLEEYARHNGHADLLRERIDGSVGE